MYCEEEWNREWQGLLEIASSEPRCSSTTGAFHERSTSGSIRENVTFPNVYESLEEIHVLALAHILRRTVIVIADTTLKDVTGEPLAPIPFGGIYLPLECPPSECHRSPLCLTFDAAHFSALVAMEKENYIDTSTHPPVVDPHHRVLPVQFVVDPGEQVRWGNDENDSCIMAKLAFTDVERLELLKEYLDIIEVPIPVIDTHETVQGFEDGVLFSVEPGTSSGEDCRVETLGSMLYYHKNRAAKQLQTVAKQFGSIGKSMGKKLKKNFGNFSRRRNSFKGEVGSFTKRPVSTNKKSVIHDTQPTSGSIIGSSTIIIAAVLHTDKRHKYQEEMVRNYLNSARARYLHEKEQKQGCSEQKGETTVRPNYCINDGCMSYGSVATSYLCPSCHTSQKLQELDTPCIEFRDKLSTASQNSSFYAQIDKSTISSLEKVPLGVQYPTASHKGFHLVGSNFDMPAEEESLLPDRQVGGKEKSLEEPFLTVPGTKYATVSTGCVSAVKSTHYF
ncbi:OTU domain-containing protein 7B-like isoform X2 [Tachypleus tridentatus]|uniref:OTU domain-containing protein 7B-like isoform X2 n=1 Tax=Tachypleus tridentatus TaxID=6853 RepID=UPI003FD37746